MCNRRKTKRQGCGDADSTYQYGKEPQKCARKMLEDGLYHAACSDAHRPDDVEEVLDGMKYIRKRYGDEEVARLFHEGPREILAGKVGS